MRRAWAYAGGAGVFLSGALAFAWAVTAGSSPSKPQVRRDVPYIEDRVIVYSPDFARRAAVQVTAARRAALSPTLRLVGTVTFDPARVAVVGTRVRGFVRSAPKLEGDHVEEGDVLGEIESADVGQAQADVAVARAQAEAAAINARRERGLLEKSLTTARESEVAEATLATQRAALEAATQRARALGGGGPRDAFGVFVLRAPIAGSVVERHVATGQSVEGHMLAYRIADLSRVWIELGVPERNAASVHVGDRVEITPVSDGKVTIAGEVAHIGEIVDLSSRTADVRVAVRNEERLLRPGQSVFARVVAAGQAREALVVPQSSIAYVDGRATVFVATSRGDGQKSVAPTTVRLGASDETSVEIVEGLAEGQEVASSGVFALKSELFR